MGKYGEGIGKPSEQEAWEWFSDNYPSVAAYMEDYESDCRKRSDKGDYCGNLYSYLLQSVLTAKIFYQRLPVIGLASYMKKVQCYAMTPFGLCLIRINVSRSPTSTLKWHG